MESSLILLRLWQFSRVISLSNFHKLNVQSRYMIPNINIDNCQDKQTIQINSNLVHYLFFKKASQPPPKHTILCIGIHIIYSCNEYKQNVIHCISIETDRWTQNTIQLCPKIQIPKICYSLSSLVHIVCIIVIVCIEFDINSAISHICTSDILFLDFSFIYLCNLKSDCKDIFEYFV